MVQMISESKRKIAALALAGAMAIGGAAGVATTIASPAQNQSGIVMEAEAATDYSKTDPNYTALGNCLTKSPTINIAPTIPYTLTIPAELSYYKDKNTKVTTKKWVFHHVTRTDTPSADTVIQLSIPGNSSGTSNKVKFSTTVKNYSNTQGGKIRLNAYYTLYENGKATTTKKCKVVYSDMTVSACSKVAPAFRDSKTFKLSSGKATVNPNYILADTNVGWVKLSGTYSKIASERVTKVEPIDADSKKIISVSYNSSTGKLTVTPKKTGTAYIYSYFVDSKGNTGKIKTKYVVS